MRGEEKKDPFLLFICLASALCLDGHSLFFILSSCVFFVWSSFLIFLFKFALVGGFFEVGV